MAKPPKNSASKKSKEKAPHEIIKKRSGRYAVMSSNGKYINGDAKTAILIKEGLIKKLTPKAKPESAPV